MNIREIANTIEKVVPLELQEDYDNSGLLIGDPGMEVTAALICLDVTMEVAGEAVRKNCNLIITHHPLMFSGIRKLTFSDDEQRVIAFLIREGIALYTIHTNLDNSYRGLNDLLGEKLSITNRRILAPMQNSLFKFVTFCPHEHADKVRMALFEVGAGHIGNYDCCSYNLEGRGSFRASEGASPFVGEINRLHFEEETRIEVIFPGYLENSLVEALKRSHPYEEVAYDIYPLANRYERAGAGIFGILQREMSLQEILGMIKTVTGIPMVRYKGNLQKRIRKVALCTGSGAFLIGKAMKEKSDLYLTSDLKYHDFFKPDKGMALADIGHYESEQFVKEWIYSFLNEKIPNFALLISEVITNPVNYY